VEEQKQLPMAPIEEAEAADEGLELNQLQMISDVSSAMEHSSPMSTISF
jgi:hypothetical protein